MDILSDMVILMDIIIMARDITEGMGILIRAKDTIAKIKNKNRFIHSLRLIYYETTTIHYKKLPASQRRIYRIDKFNMG